MTPVEGSKEENKSKVFWNLYGEKSKIFLVVKQKLTMALRESLKPKLRPIKRLSLRWEIMLELPSIEQHLERDIDQILQVKFLKLLKFTKLSLLLMLFLIKMVRSLMANFIMKSWFWFYNDLQHKFICSISFHDSFGIYRRRSSFSPFYSLGLMFLRLYDILFNFNSFLFHQTF